MPRRYVLFALLLFAAATLIATPGFADRPAARLATPPGTPASGPADDVRTLSVPACQLCVTDDPHPTMQYLYPPDDEYYTLIDPASCGCPGSAGVSVTRAHVALEFAGNCTLPVSVGVVAADLSDPGCPRPIPGQYLCPPVDFEIEGVEGDPDPDYVIPLPAGCCITQKAFLVIIFRDLDSCGGLPALWMTFGCDPCVSWNSWPGGDLVDLCDGYILGNPNMYVDGTCCNPVPTLPQTWGQLKSLYR